MCSSDLSLRPDLQGLRAPRVTLASGQTHRVRLLTWLEGQTLAGRGERSAQLLGSLGDLLGQVCRALGTLPQPGPLPARRWDLAQAGWTFALTRESLGRLNRRVPGPQALDALQRFQLLFAAEVLPVLDDLPQAVLHGDANDHNLLLQATSEGERVTGLIDFGDVTWGPRVFDLAIACAYAIHGQDDPLQAMGQIVAAHNKHVPLSEQELAVFFPALGMRLVQSVVVSASDGAQHAADSYLRVSEAPAWETLVLLADIEPREAQRCLRRACGLSEPAVDARDLDAQQIRQVRERHLGPSLSTAYSEPLHLVRGRGAYLGSRRLRVSSATTIDESLIATGFAYDVHCSDADNLQHFGRMLKAARGIRRDGSAALDLCYVAAGRLDAYWEFKLYPWDVAAGCLIVEEAGGVVTDVSGGPAPPSGVEIVASNGSIHDEFLKLLSLPAIPNAPKEGTP